MRPCGACKKAAICRDCEAYETWHRSDECGAFVAAPAEAKRGDTAPLRAVLRYAALRRRGPWRRDGLLEPCSLIDGLAATPAALAALDDAAAAVIGAAARVDADAARRVTGQIQTNAIQITRRGQRAAAALSAHVGFTNHACTGRRAGASRRDAARLAAVGSRASPFFLILAASTMLASPSFLRCGSERPNAKSSRRYAQRRRDRRRGGLRRADRAARPQEGRGDYDLVRGLVVALPGASTAPEGPLRLRLRLPALRDRAQGDAPEPEALVPGRVKILVGLACFASPRGTLAAAAAPRRTRVHEL